MHLVEDNAVFEPVDADNRPVPAGTQAAKLLLTNVINPLLPLIRYELTDEVTLLTGPTSSPWTGRRLDVSGRFDDLFWYEGGKVVHPYVFRSTLGRTPEVLEYQVRQTPRGAEALVRAVAGANLEPLRRDLLHALGGLGLAEPTVTLTAVNAIERLPGTGKLKRFVPLPRS
jgi:phenylacetate-coenzyme A ligase PaaK-like adenylate-forming protein